MDLSSKLESEPQNFIPIFVTLEEFYSLYPAHELKRVQTIRPQTIQPISNSDNSVKMSETIRPDYSDSFKVLKRARKNFSHAAKHQSFH